MRAHRRFAALAVPAALVCTLSAGTARAILVYETGEEIYEVADVPEDMAELVAAKLVALGHVPKEAETELVPLLEDEFGGNKIGYKCNLFGLFFADIWRWNCNLMVYEMTGADSFEYMSATLGSCESEAQEKATDPDAAQQGKAFCAAVIGVLQDKTGKKDLEEAYPLSDARKGFWRKHGRWILLLVLIAIIVGSILMKRNKSETAAGMPPSGGAFPPSGGQFPPSGGQFPPPGGQQFPPPGGQQFPPSGGQFGPPGGQFPPNQG
jgi:hypothetical protein